MRESMTALVAIVRGLIDDNAVPPHYDDDKIQEALDAHALDVRYEQTRALETRGPGGARSYLEHRHTRTHFEAAQLTDASYNEITAAASDLITGRWTLAESRQVVYVVGTSYDVHGAASDLVEEWAASYKLKSNFTDSGLTINYGQRYEQLVALAERLRKRARTNKPAQTGRLISTDFRAC
jgi:hypothetical protein